MQTGDLALTPDGNLVRIGEITDGDYWPAEYDFGQMVYPAGGYVVWMCSDGNEYDDRELTPIEPWVNL